MQQSRRTKRMKRNHARNKAGGLNLVSLMDIFTILVFFLLVNTSNSYQLPNANDITLPTAKTENAPEETLVIAITREDIIFEGKKIARLSDLESESEEIFFPLKNALSADSPATNSSQERKVTIISDENIPYFLLKKLLTTLQSEQFNKISFAAIQQDK